METPSADAVIVAAGSSTRMGGIDKTLALVGGRPLIAWTIDAFVHSPVVARIVVVTSWANSESITHADWLPHKVTQVVVGGQRRQESVARGLETLRSRTRGHTRDDRLERVVLVHDGARPVVTTNLIEAVTRETSRHGAAIPVIPLLDTVKRVDGERIESTIDRSGLVSAQTPQGVRGSLMVEAYDQYPPSGPATWTDEAALLEACNIPVHVLPGDPGNFKVTYPADLERAATVLGVDRPRVGYGDDSHPFGPGEPLMLGGIEFPGAPRLAGHSDGDVVLHAVADALLGAAGLGDLGRLFPADARTPQGIASAVLLTEVVALVTKAGLRPSNVDVTIVAGRPHLGGRLDTIRTRLAELLRVRVDQVNVKASSGNLDGAEGAGRGISARAVVTLERLR